MAKSVLDKDLKKVVRIETATYALSRSIATPGLLAVFVIGSITLASLSIVRSPLGYFVIVAAVIAAYMALNVGANDVANNMGPAVGSRALTLTGSRSPPSAKRPARSSPVATSSTPLRATCCGRAWTCARSISFSS